MKYQYLYQTKENENRSGWISARNRENAYALLRKRGIRPYRLIGDDPVNWRPWAVGAVVALLVAALTVALFRASGDSGGPLPRQQLVGNPEVIDTGVYSGWIDVLPLMLDRRLAAYAQPGRMAIPPEATEAEIARFPEELAMELAYVKGEPPEYRMLKRIVRRMREDMAEFLAAGGTVDDYLVFLDDRQEQEHDFRVKAVDAVLRAPESMRDRVLLGVNARLKDMAIEPVTIGTDQ